MCQIDINNDATNELISLFFASRNAFSNIKCNITWRRTEEYSNFELAGLHIPRQAKEMTSGSVGLAV